VDDLFHNIDDRLNPKDKIKKTDYNLFESKIAKSLGMITEGLDSFLKIIENPTSQDSRPIFNYLRTATPDEVEDWVNALEIAVVDREIMNRWVLGLAQDTSKLPNLPSNIKPVLSGVLEALSAAPWSEQPEESEEPVDETDYMSKAASALSGLMGPFLGRIRALKRRDPQLEREILNYKGKDWNYQLGAIIEYSKEILKNRWPEGEKILLTIANQDKSNLGPEYVLAYIKHVVKGAWPEGEQILRKSKYWLDQYKQFLKSAK